MTILFIKTFQLHTKTPKRLLFPSLFSSQIESNRKAPQNNLLEKYKNTLLNGLGFVKLFSIRKRTFKLRKAEIRRMTIKNKSITLAKE